MKTIGAYEAKTHFAQLIQEVAQGETVTITRHGVPVVKMSPVSPPVRPDLDRRMEEWEEYRRRRNITLGGLSIREMIEEGRM